MRGYIHSKGVKPLDSIKKGFRCWIQAWIELFIFLPFLLIPGYFVFNDAGLYIWLAVLPFFYVFGYIITKSFKKKYRIFITFLFVNILVSTLMFSGILAFLVGFVSYIVFNSRGYLFSQRDISQFFPPNYYWFGLTMYFASYITILYFDRNHELITYITYFGFLAIIITLFSNNQKILQSNALPGKTQKVKLSSRMIKHNRLFILVFLLGCYGVTSFSLIGEMLQTANARLSAWINGFFQRDREITDRVFDEVGREIAVGKPKEPSAWVSFLEQSMYVVVIILGVIIGLLLLYAIIKGCIRLFKYIRSWILNKMGLQADENMDQGLGYVDEKENLLDMKKILHNAMGKAKSWMSNDEKWSHQQTNDAKIRFLYRLQLYQVMRKGYIFKPELTPNETIEDIKLWNKESQLEDNFSDAYNRTRYGHQIPDDETIDKLKEKSGIKLT